VESVDADCSQGEVWASVLVGRLQSSEAGMVLLLWLDLVGGDGESSKELSLEVPSPFLGLPFGAGLSVVAPAAQDGHGRERLGDVTTAVQVGGCSLYAVGIGRGLC
jgi:hypothetical protein